MKYNSIKVHLVIVTLLVTTKCSIAQRNKLCGTYLQESVNLYKADKFKEALNIFKSAVNDSCELTKLDYYNGACFASKANDTFLANNYLNTAVKKGYDDLLFMSKDADLEALRGTIEYINTTKLVQKKFLSLKKELVKINSNNFSLAIPYLFNGKWGWLNKNTLQPLTKPIFQYTDFMSKDGLYFVYKNEKYIYTNELNVSVNRRYAGEDNMVSAGERTQTILSDTNFFKGFKADKYGISEISREFSNVQLVPESRVKERIGIATNLLGLKGIINEDGSILDGFNFKFAELAFFLNDSKNTFPATDYVVINFVDEFENFSAGSKAKMPALMALYIFNKDRRDFIITSSKVLLDIGLFAIGVGEVEAAITAYRAGKTAYQAYVGLKALGDLGMSLGDMVVNNVMANSWKNTPEGRERLERWNTISMYWAIGSISSTALEGVLKKYCKNEAKILDNESQFNNMADELEAEVNAVKALEQSTSAALLAKGLSQADVDNIIIRAMYIDDKLGNNKMMNLINELANNNKFKNPLDIYDPNRLSESWLNIVAQNGTPDLNKAKSLVNEIEEGIYWMNRGEDVYISKKLSPGATCENEVDVVIINGANKGIVECKFPNVVGSNAENNIFANLEEIIKKFKLETKLTTQYKTIYPKKFGQINFANGAFPNLNTAAEFVNLVRGKNLIGNTAGVSKFTLSELQAIEELHLIIGNKRIIVHPTDW